MKLKLLFLACFAVLSACCFQSETKKVPICTGNILKSCSPVVYFEFDSYELSSESKRNLDWAIERMKRFPHKTAVASGHADTRGNPDKNLNLSKKRSLSVKNYMVQQGIDRDRIIVKFSGEKEPVCIKETCQELNRRVELRL